MFTFTDLSVECEGNVFMPVQALNKMRRDVLEKLKEEILSGYRRNSSVPPTKEEETLPVREPSEKIPEFTAFVQTKAQFETVLGKFKDVPGNYPRENTGSIWRRRALMPRSGKNLRTAAMRPE